MPTLPVTPLVPGASSTGDTVLQSAAAANGNGTAMSVVGDAVVDFTVTMTGFTGTVTFQGSEDTVNFDPINVTQSGTGTITNNVVGSTTTSTHIYEASISGLQRVQAVVSNYSAGTVTVTANATALTRSTNQSNVAQIGGTLVPAIGDSVAFAGQMPAIQMGQTGTGVVSVERVPNIIKNVPGTAITAGTPVSIWTPTTGKKFRLMGYHLSSTVASSLIFKDGTSGGSATEFVRTPIQAVNTGTPSPPLGNGFLSAAANNQLWLDATASGTIHGFVLGVEE